MSKQPIYLKREFAKFLREKAAPLLAQKIEACADWAMSEVEVYRQGLFSQFTGNSMSAIFAQQYDGNGNKSSFPTMRLQDIVVHAKVGKDKRLTLTNPVEGDKRTVVGDTELLGKNVLVSRAVRESRNISSNRLLYFRFGAVIEYHPELAERYFDLMRQSLRSIDKAGRADFAKKMTAERERKQRKIDHYFQSQNDELGVTLDI